VLAAKSFASSGGPNPHGLLRRDRKHPNSAAFQDGVGLYDAIRVYIADGEEPEHSAKSARNNAVLPERAAESGAVDAPLPPVDADLAAVAAAWPALPEVARQRILAIVHEEAQS
jgi:hypothetical protein